MKRTILNDLLAARAAKHPVALITELSSRYASAVQPDRSVGFTEHGAQCAAYPMHYGARSR